MRTPIVLLALAALAGCNKTTYTCTNEYEAAGVVEVEVSIVDNYLVITGEQVKDHEITKRTPNTISAGKGLTTVILDTGNKHLTYINNLSFRTERYECR